MKKTLGFLVLSLLTGCMTGGSHGVFPLVWSNNGCALYPLYYQSTTDLGQTETYWMLCGLTGWRTQRGELKTDWLVPLYARGDGWFASIPYTTVDNDRRGSSQFWLAGLGGRIEDEQGAVDRHWVVPFYYRDRAWLVTPFYGKSFGIEWVFPLYYDGWVWSANLLYAQYDDEEEGESGWLSPWIMTKSGRTAGGRTDFISPLYGWTGEGTSQTNRWWTTPLVGTRSGHADGWWAFPFYDCQTDVRFDEKRRAFEGEMLPDTVTFPEETLVDTRGGTSVRKVLKGSLRANDENNWFVLFANDDLISDAYSPKTGWYTVMRRRVFGNRFLLGWESWRERLFEATNRQEMSEHEGCSFSLLWRLFRYERGSDGTTGLHLFFWPVY